MRPFSSKEAGGLLPRTMLSVTRILKNLADENPRKVGEASGQSEGAGAMGEQGKESDWDAR
jgi:hypothetical protein